MIPFDRLGGEFGYKLKMKEQKSGAKLPLGKIIMGFIVAEQFFSHN